MAKKEQNGTTPDNAVIPMNFDGVKESELLQLSKDYANLVVQRDKESFDSGKKARQVLRKERYAIQNIVKEKKAILNDVKKRIEDQGQQYIDIILPAETHIDNQIKSIEEEIAKEREEKRIAEEARKEKLRIESIEFVESYRGKVRASTSVNELKKIQKELDNLVVPDFEDYTNSAVIHINNILEVEIPERKGQIVRDEELKKQQEENARLKLQLESMQRTSSADELIKLVEPELGNVNSYLEKPADLGSTKKELRTVAESITDIYSPDLALNDAETALMEEIRSKLKDVQDYMYAEIDKLFPG